MCFIRVRVRLILSSLGNEQITITPSDQTSENPASPARPGLGKDESQELFGSSTQKPETRKFAEPGAAWPRRRMSRAS
jgi:hypothetical protein